MRIIRLISQYSSCQLWIEGLRSPSTQKAYAFHLWQLCKFYKTNPDQLLKADPKDLKEMIVNYVLDMKKAAKNSAGKPKRGQRSVNSIKSYVKGIKSFFDEHEINLPWNKISKYIPEDVTNDYRSYTRDEISKLLSIANLRDRCIVLLMASSGIRVGAISDLTLKSLKKLDDGLGLLTAYGNSKKSAYNTLVTQECLSTIDEYLVQRRKQGETVNEHSILIRDKYSIFNKRVNRPKCLTTGAINQQMRLLLRKAALPFEELQPDHALRRFFDTTLINSNVDPKFKAMLMGHSIKLDDVYYDKKNEVSSNKLRLEYMKAADALTINDEFRLRKQIVEAEDKLKNVPKMELLQEQLTNRIIEQDSIKQTVEKLQREKELQDRYYRKRETELNQKHEHELKTMREHIDHTLEEMMVRIQNEMDMMVQKNPQLARIKREMFVTKKIGNKAFSLLKE
jgi:integrase